jgi:hypothetical protein
LKKTPTRQQSPTTESLKTPFFKQFEKELAEKRGSLKKSPTRKVDVLTPVGEQYKKDKAKREMKEFNKQFQDITSRAGKFF